MSSQNISTSSTSSGGFEAIEESVMASNASEKAEKVTRTIKMSTVSDIGGSREMQDSVGFNAKRVIVADGHGTYGKGIADYSVLSALHHSEYFGDELFGIMERSASATIERALLNANVSWSKTGDCFFTHDGNLVRGGTTATVLSILDDGIELSHVGDSEAMCVDCDKGSFEIMTADHSATNLAEFLDAKKRFPGARFMFEKPLGYQVEREVFRQTPEGEWVMNTPMTYSTVRNDFGSYVSLNGNTIAMTRAIGDFHMGESLTHLPTTVRRKDPETPATHAYVIASDGMWDAVQYQAICDIVCEKRFVETLDTDEAAKALMAYAKHENLKHFGRNYENIGIAVVYVRYE
jgi:serine/threonine protein phosphatase PrpC